MATVEHPKDPRREYQQRLTRRQATLDARQGRDRTISNLRLAVFLIGLAVTLVVLLTDLVYPAWLALPAILFGVLVVLHDRAIRQRDLAREAVAYYQRALDRLDHKWPGSGIQTTDYVPPEHPYCADLDLFGHGSLFELLCAARTRAGEETLARWLSAPAAVETIEARQRAVDDLRQRLDLREDLALLGGGVRSEVRPQVIQSWGTAPPVFTDQSATFLKLVAWVLGVATATALILWLCGMLIPNFPIAPGPLPFFALGFVEWAVYKLYSKQVLRVMFGTDQPERDLRVLAVLLSRLEAEAFTAPRLQQLQHDLRVEGGAASVAIGQLARLVMWMDSQRNAFFIPFGLIVMWGVHFALAIERWRKRAGHKIPGWIDAVAEFEALSSLAGYAYEHPADPFPELVREGTLLDGEDLGHPLVPDDKCVRNSVKLDQDVPIWIVSGSNMSGKTTLMRFVGVNAVLAQAGAPVRATRLRLSPLSIGATIRIQDSLLAGRSRFYEEIKRLQQLMDLAEAGPLLFLLDEVLHGTNSHDRQIGAAAVLRQLMELGAVGLVTTHDLALADAGEELSGRLRNKHFVDRVEQGELIFDYQLQEGVVQRSNAIALMRAVGLKV